MTDDFLVKPLPDSREELEGVIAVLRLNKNIGINDVLH